MFPGQKNTRIYVRPGATDMRKQINGLATLTQHKLDLAPLSGDLYVFCNRQRKILKALYWERNGFCLWQKRLEKGSFPWPRDEREAIEIDKEKLRMILDGIDFWHMHRAVEYKSVI